MNRNIYNYKGKKSRWPLLLDFVGETPLIKITYPNLNVYAKIEYYNPTGSIKDRAASYFLKYLSQHKSCSEMKLIESSSGNFGISLAAYSSLYKIPFYCVVDPNLLSLNKYLLESYGANIITVCDMDNSGSYLGTRIKKIQEMIEFDKSFYWVNQYNNAKIVESYRTVGIEILKALKKVDYIFIGVSSGGTITGISQIMKESNPKTKIIAVDTIGSLIFSNEAKKRFIPGIGSSKIPENLKNAKIDDVMLIDEMAAIEECHRLLKVDKLFLGGSSGSVSAAIKGYFRNKNFYKDLTVVAVFPDSGTRYYDTIYNYNWIRSKYNTLSDEVMSPVEVMNAL